MSKSKTAIIAVSFVLAGIIAIQFIPVEKSNPRATGDIKMPEEVHSIIKRACYDCHSFETKWPWYSKIAPISMLIAKDVNKGREYLNFSIWEDLSEEGKQNLKNVIWEKISNDEMPLLQYRIAHSEAKLTDRDKETIRGWCESNP